MVCTFFGHKDTPKEIELTLRSTLRLMTNPRFSPIRGLIFYQKEENGNVSTTTHCYFFHILSSCRE